MAECLFFSGRSGDVGTEMRRYWISVLCCVLGVGLLGFVGAQAPENPVEDAFYIRSMIYEGQRRRPPVEFTHLQHVEQYASDCTECHHEYQPGQAIQKCGECHLDEDEFAPSLQNAFHKTCRECHVDSAGVESSAPIKCSECHGQIDYHDFEFSRTRPPVVFTHLNHWQKYNTPCSSCHHRYEDGENVWKRGDPVQKCNECHKATKQDNVVKLKTAFHKQCKTCHKGLVDQGIQVPYKCSECHYDFKDFPYRAFPKLTD